MFKPELSSQLVWIVDSGNGFKNIHTLQKEPFWGQI